LTSGELTALVHLDESQAIADLELVDQRVEELLRFPELGGGAAPRDIDRYYIRVHLMRERAAVHGRASGHGYR
jgi:hypothetical protein